MLTDRTMRFVRYIKRGYELKIVAEPGPKVPIKNFQPSIIIVTEY
jgi:hypothetical protein